MAQAPSGRFHLRGRATKDKSPLVRFEHVFISVLALGLVTAKAGAQTLTRAGVEPQDRGAEATAAVPRDVLPPEYPPPSARTSLALAGAGVFAAWYAGSVGASLLWSDAPGASDLRIPVVGPWLSLQHTGCADSEPDCSTAMVVIRALLTVMDGVGQLGGLGAIGEAIFLPTASARPGSEAKRGSVRAAPFVAGSDGVGLGVLGAF